MTRDGELERLVETVNRLGLGQFSVIPPSEFVDRWDVTFDQLLSDVARVASVYRCSKVSKHRLF